MNKYSRLTLLLPILTVALLTGCNDKEKTKSLTEGGMKCGPGKCGAAMMDEVDEAEAK